MRLLNRTDEAELALEEGRLAMVGPCLGEGSPADQLPTTTNGRRFF